MKFQKLGNTDIDVSVVALGTWGLGGGRELHRYRTGVWHRSK